MVERDAADAPSEMEALMHWLLSERTPLAEEHAEFGQLRDMAALYKFLATMETREVEQVCVCVLVATSSTRNALAQLRRRHAVREYQPWRLTFDDASMKSGGMRVRFLGV